LAVDRFRQAVYNWLSPGDFREAPRDNGRAWAFCDLDKHGLQGFG